MQQVVTLGPMTIQRIKLTYNTVFSAPAGAALATAISYTTASVFAGYGNFANQITNLFNEYRIHKIALRIVPVPGVSGAGLYPTGLYLTTFEGPNTPVPSIAIIQRYPQHRVLPLSDKVSTITWTAQADPEDRTFATTTAALPVVGGIVGYIGASAPVAAVAYMTVEASFWIEARGRLV